MFLKKLKLKNLRNYESCEIDFTANTTLLIGKNAQGKTNLLEAIYYLATLSSFRTGTDNEILKWGCDQCIIEANLFKHSTDIELKILLNPPKQKILKVNGLKKTSFSSFLGNLLVVSFTVSDLLLLRGSPSDRRKWLDDAISQIYPAYKDRLSKYSRIRIQRNNLLKEFKSNFSISTQQEDLLSVLDEQLAVSGSNIIHLRMKYLREIQEKAYQKHKSISLSEEDLKIVYESSITGDFDAINDELPTSDKIFEVFKGIFEKKRKEEIIRAQTVIGPHRDDIGFMINGKNAVNFASQGQQRTVALALKLSEIDLLEEIIKESPILLLDDVLAELDTERQEFLLKSINKGTQTIITTTSVSAFNNEFLKDKKLYKVSSGSVEEYFSYEKAFV
ncbi:MAG TPA: DNA replication/repair protein RecF [Candidatus Gastranaerophilales bacterium]|nr:DNA replication/repair protein RecF [Candidatus Gastranaerophilales bacterium]